MCVTTKIKLRLMPVLVIFIPPNRNENNKLKIRCQTTKTCRICFRDFGSSASFYDDFIAVVDLTCIFLSLVFILILGQHSLVLIQEGIEDFTANLVRLVTTQRGHTHVCHHDIQTGSVKQINIGTNLLPLTRVIN